MERPQNVGIKAMELYFPSQCVDQAELEKHDGVSQGKYTIGLGQTKMSFCDDREDIYSLALTALSSLFRKYNIDPASIGRLEVGTETLLDKSKSVKSVLMQLFKESGNNNVEGIDTIHACYGGTNAVFNSVNWVESSAWDGRDAIVVTGDIAIYSKGNARPSGGVGCVAMLIGPNAPLVLEPGMRGTYVQHTYDFYKPDLTSEYPVVDGHYSLRCYAEALDNCYKNYNTREAKRLALTNGTNGTHAADEQSTPLDRFDYMCFHSPTCKTVAKSYSRLLYNDYLVNPTHPAFAEVPESLKSLDYQASLSDKDVEKVFLGLSKKRFAARVQPSIEAPNMCGNMYSASVWGGLCSLLANVSSDNLQGKRIGMYSFGSGLAASFFSFRVHGSTTDVVGKLDFHKRLAARNVIAPTVYEEMLALRENAHLAKNYTPSGNPDTLFPGTYYLTGIDDMFRRTYAVKQ